MILDRIVEKKKLRLQNKKLEFYNNIEKGNYSENKFIKKFKENDFTIIGEFKKASPSKGIIAENFNIKDILNIYENLPIGTYSVLTEEDFFLGKNEYLKEIGLYTERPILRKDFIIDKYQIYEAKTLGASAVLLIVSILGENLSEYYSLTKELGLAALVEVHNKEELDIALKTGCLIIGINNRDLKTFKVDLKNTEELIKYIPKEKIVISESGIKSINDMKYLDGLWVDGVLIGET